jgi:hypothetical protein
MEGVRAEALGQTKLALDDLVNQLYASQDPPGVEEALESEHRAGRGFLPSGDLVGRRQLANNAGQERALIVQEVKRRSGK